MGNHIAKTMKIETATEGIQGSYTLSPINPKP